VWRCFNVIPIGLSVSSPSLQSSCALTGSKLSCKLDSTLPVRNTSFMKSVVLKCGHDDPLEVSKLLPLDKDLENVVNSLLQIVPEIFLCRFHSFSEIKENCDFHFSLLQ
jgi:hypothetical protein